MECRVSWGFVDSFISACLIWGDSAPRGHGVMSGTSVLVMGEGSWHSVGGEQGGCPMPSWYPGHPHRGCCEPRTLWCFCVFSGATGPAGAGTLAATLSMWRGCPTASAVCALGTGGLLAPLSTNTCHFPTSAEGI